jgi:YVTN family beta-propeller protein
VGRLAAMVASVLLWMGCGQVYRPVVIPCSAGGGIPGCPVETAPTPDNFHTVFSFNANTLHYPGGAMQIDVSGDTIIGETPTADPSAPNLGINLTNAAILPNDSVVFVASASSVYSGGLDVVSSFTPVFQSRLASGLGAVVTIPVPSLPNQAATVTAISEAGNLVTATLSAPLSNVTPGYAIAIANVLIPNCLETSVPPCNPEAYNGTFPLSTINGSIIQYVNPVAGLAATTGGNASVPPQPVFLNSTQSSAMFVANYNSNSVSVINTSSNIVTASTTVGAHPVSMAEMPNALKIYVANEGDNTVSSVNAADLSQNNLVGFSGVTPVWVVARGDNQKVYVVTQGDGQLVTIDTATDTVTSSIAMGGGASGANFIYLDPILNRLYVVNPVTSMIYVFADTGGADDTPLLLTTIPFTSGSAACPNGCTPVSVTSLPDGSRFYVASYQATTACPAGSGVSGACVIPSLTVFNASTYTLQYPNTPTLNLLAAPPACTVTVSNPCTQSWPFLSGQTAVPQVASCNTPPGTLYTPAPTQTRFRMFATAATDGSHVYVSMCDAGAVADIVTSGNNANNSGAGIPPDTLITDLLTAPAASSGTALQNPIFLLAGQ